MKIIRDRRKKGFGASSKRFVGTEDTTVPGPGSYHNHAFVDVKPESKYGFGVGKR